MAINISSHLLNMRVEACAVCLNLNWSGELWYICAFLHKEMSVAFVFCLLYCFLSHCKSMIMLH